MGAARRSEVQLAITSLNSGSFSQFSFQLLGRLADAQEDNPSDDQAKAEDGEGVFEHDYFLRLAVAATLASMTTRTPTQRMRILGTQRPT